MARDDNRVALISAYYPSHGGGMELACAELAGGLSRAGLQVEWLAQSDGPLSHDFGVQCSALPGSDVIYSLSGVPMPLPVPWALPSLWRAVKRADVVVVVEVNFVISVMGFLAARFYRKPVLVIQHVGQPSTVSTLARVVMRLGEVLAVRPILRKADAVVWVSPVVARYFSSVRASGDSFTIGHGVDMKTFRPPADLTAQASERERLGLKAGGKLACFVGRLTASKGIAVVAEMARLRPDWTFAIAGSGPVDPNSWGLANVATLGQLDRAEVACLYRASDVMVLPSQSESFSLVVREALASGSHPLCSDQILETDPGLAPFVTTRAVDLLDISGTARRFAAVLGGEVGERSHDARQYVAAKCSWDAANARYVRLIEGLLHGARQVSP